MWTQEKINQIQTEIVEKGKEMNKLDFWLYYYNTEFDRKLEALKYENKQLMEVDTGALQSLQPGGHSEK